MADRITPEARSANMSRVRNRDTGPELRVRKLLHREGYRFRLQRRDLPGRPDIYLPKHKVAIFVHGCFWHGHEGCKRSKLPDTRAEFWSNKIAANRNRDADAVERLRAAGVAVVTLWECQLKDDRAILQRVAEATNRGGAKDGEATKAA
jgi:DNA mismatch endonuclease (patch repair protein)